MTRDPIKNVNEIMITNCYIVTVRIFIKNGPEKRLVLKI